MKTVILAGGFGTRISEESYLRPKPMIEIGEMPILWHIMKFFSFYGHHEFVICCGYKGYMIKEYFADYYLHRSDVTFDFTVGNSMIVHRHLADPWKVTLVDTGLHTQTGGRIRRVQQYLDNERFFMTYGDGVSNINLENLLQQHIKSKKTVTLSAVQPEPRFGVLDIGNDGETIIGFHEKPIVDGNWINAGFMVMEKDVFNYLPEDECVLESEALEFLGKEEKLGVYKHRGFWQCMDTQRDRRYLEKLWAEGAPWAIW